MQIEKQRDDAEQERAELQRFTTSFFNDETERSRSATKMSWKTSANAVRIASTKKVTAYRISVVTFFRMTHSSPDLKVSGLILAMVLDDIPEYR